MAQQPEPNAVKVMAAVVGVTSLLILVQAFTGGLIARESNRQGFEHFHQGLGYAVAVAAIATVVVAVMMWRGRAGGQVVLAESIALLVGVAVQIGIGLQIGKIGEVGKHAGLLAIHVPLGLLLFGLTVHLSAFVSNMRRSVA